MDRKLRLLNLYLAIIFALLTIAAANYHLEYPVIYRWSCVEGIHVYWHTDLPNEGLVGTSAVVMELHREKDGIIVEKTTLQLPFWFKVDSQTALYAYPSYAMRLFDNGEWYIKSGYVYTAIEVVPIDESNYDLNPIWIFCKPTNYMPMNYRKFVGF